MDSDYGADVAVVIREHTILSSLADGRADPFTCATEGQAYYWIAKERRDHVAKAKMGVGAGWLAKDRPQAAKGLRVLAAS